MVEMSLMPLMSPIQSPACASSVADEDERPPMVAALSPSSMATWRQCPKRFFYEKILRLETETGEPAVCGSFVHLVLEHLMDIPAGERTIEAARSLAAEAWPDFAEDPSEHFADLGLSAEDVKAFKRKAWEGISGYFRIEDPNTVDVLGTEEEVWADLDGAPVYGIIDRVDQGPAGLVVTDYKSGKAPAWEDERQEKLGQLRTYAAMLEANGRHVSELRLLFVSPQVAAWAKSSRCDEAAAECLARLESALPGVDAVEGVITAEIAQRTAWEANRGVLGARQVADGAAVEAARSWALTWAAGSEDVVTLMLETVATRKRAFFAGRAASAARPTTVALQVTPEDLDLARAEAASIWAAASDCYEAWDFPGLTGPLCDWCPFAAQCPALAAWDAAGRPPAESAVADACAGGSGGSGGLGGLGGLGRPGSAPDAATVAAPASLTA